MTVNEIQSTLDTLRIRHPSLNEVMLRTLLSAGGWDEKSIREAEHLFREPTHEELSPQKSLPPLLKDYVLPEMVSSDHMLVEHNEESKDLAISTKEIKITKEEKEPQSLITPEGEQTLKRDVDLPENLPLRPFESTPHVWPFSRYKDVFYGEVMPSLSLEEIQEAKKQVIKQVHVEAIPLTKKDEGLIVLASTMLLVILILLGYMYSNGRL